MTDHVARTVFYNWHVAHGARIVEFGGWSMPVQYSSIVAEHQATRSSVGVFDISHMGRLRFSGADAERFLDRMLTRKVDGIGPGKIRYSLVCNDRGGVLDDVLVYRLTATNGVPFFYLVVNAGNRIKIVDWLRSHIASEYDVDFVDETLATAMIAVQGPRAIAAMSQIVSTDISQLGNYTGVVTSIGAGEGIVSRTGYTGEDGCELIVDNKVALPLMAKIEEAAKSLGGLPVGLGARDTLRLEAGMPLYGNELSEEIDPFTAGLSFAVQMQRDFVGRQALQGILDQGLISTRVGLLLSGKRVAREHSSVVVEGTSIGTVTSGTFSPSLEKPIAMAYVRAANATLGSTVGIDIRGKVESATIVALPFYKRP